MKLERHPLVAKPGITLSNLIAVAGRHFLAAHGSVELILLLVTIIDLSLVVANECVLDNCTDRDTDRHMERTRGWVTVVGQILLKAVLVHGLVLGVTSFDLP